MNAATTNILRINLPLLRFVGIGVLTERERVLSAAPLLCTTALVAGLFHWYDKIVEISARACSSAGFSKATRKRMLSTVETKQWQSLLTGIFRGTWLSRRASFLAELSATPGNKLAGRQFKYLCTCLSRKFSMSHSKNWLCHSSTSSTLLRIGGYALVAGTQPR